MSARQRFQKAQLEAINAARSRIHAQTDFTKDRSYVLKEISDKTYTPTKSTAAQLKYAALATRSAKADELAERYRRKGGGNLREQALRVLSEIPLPFTIEDDPSFTASAKIARAASKLSITARECTAVDNASNLILRHTYLVQHAEAVALAAALPAIYPLKAAKEDARGGSLGRFQTLSPRLKQLSAEALVSEAAAVLSAAAKLGYANDTALIESFAATVRMFHADSSTWDISRAMESLTRLAVTLESRGEGPCHDTAAGVIRAVATDVCERTGSRAMTALDGVVVLQAMGRLRDVIDRRLALTASDAVLSDIESLTPAQCAEGLQAISEMGYTHPMLARRLSSRQFLTAADMTSEDVVRTLSALTTLPDGLEPDIELYTALLARIAVLDPSMLPLRDAIVAADCIERKPMIHPPPELVAATSSLLRAIAAGAVPSATDRQLVDALRLVESHKWHRDKQLGLTTVAMLGKELARRGGLPAESAQILRTATDAVDGIINDVDASPEHREALMTALAPLLC